MFKSFVLWGASGDLVWGYRPIAKLRRWGIARTDQPRVWSLTGVVDSLDARALGKRPLLFTAPRPGRCGLWCFPVLEARLDVAGALVVTMQNPEY